MTKYFPVHTFYVGIRSVSSVTSASSLKPSIGDEGHNIIRQDNPTSTKAYKVCRSDIQCNGHRRSYTGVPINRVSVYGHRRKEFTKCHIHYFSTKSGSSEGNDDMAWDESVDYSRLSPQEREIHKFHKKAVMEKQLFYTDPCTGYQVMSRYAHLKRGDCCGNACRHCPYEHKRVADNAKNMIFNSAFYVTSGENQDT
ncbi:uncharacterized protein LOC117320974 isoform X2 [Pecten maximus]|uniref:uncharacterized protein LOC117320974 isoform X2 n=1 Tax=Pecten maximus TaxID=6579 RepID=UPI001457F8A2|nr:uncharacterized protein LOC117320974 isoform X2 [Pecten maximus]